MTAVKFWDGAWLILVLIPTFVGIMSFIHRQNEGQEHELRVQDEGVLPGPHREQRVVIPVNGINRAVVQAVNFGRALGGDIRAVCTSRTSSTEIGRASCRERVYSSV